MALAHVMVIQLSRCPTGHWTAFAGLWFEEIAPLFNPQRKGVSKDSSMKLEVKSPTTGQMWHSSPASVEDPLTKEFNGVTTTTTETTQEG